jgi:hypothetical protein
VGITGAVLTKLGGGRAAFLSVYERETNQFCWRGRRGHDSIRAFLLWLHGEPHLGNGRREQTFVQKPQEVKQDAQEMQTRILEAKFDFNEAKSQSSMQGLHGWSCQTYSWNEQGDTATDSWCQVS